MEGRARAREGDYGYGPTPRYYSVLNLMLGEVVSNSHYRCSKVGERPVTEGWTLVVVWPHIQSIPDFLPLLHSTLIHDLRIKVDPLVPFL